MNRSKKTVRHRTEVIEIVPDAALEKREARATRAVQSLCPGSRVQLYRTEDGRVMFNISQVSGLAGNKKLLDEMYRVIMLAIGEKRGRPRGTRKIQTKLNLPEPVYRRLRTLASEKSETMSDVVAELIEQV